MRTSLIQPTCQRWQEILADMEHDFYHLPEYVSFSSRHEGGDALAFLAEENGYRFLVPLLLRPIEAAGSESDLSYDVVSPYGYPGPLLSGDPHRGGGRRDFFERALREFLKGLRKLGIVSGFFRLHPLLILPIEPLADCGRIVHHGDTVFVDLTLAPEEIWRQTRSNHRRGINGAKREGHIARIDEHWREFDAFVDIYAQTMDRLGATDFYRFSRSYFVGLKEALGDRLHLCVVRVGHEVACAGLFTEVRGIVQYHLGGTREGFLSNHPTKAMFDFVRYWARQRGNHTLHLWGGLGGKSDSLFRFKAGFSELRRPFYSWRLVVDEHAYAKLVRQWERCHRQKADDLAGFFPAYRKPEVEP